MGIQLHCLHGTFQSPAVWPELEGRLRVPGEHREVRLLAEPIAPPAGGGPVEWAAGYCGRISDAKGKGDPAPVLLGYSLGGRLAMHVLLHCPEAWSAAVLVAAHPGEADVDARAAIRDRDAAWAARCRREPLESVLADWDALPVFGARPNRAPRRPGALDPERQARMFETFSRGRRKISAAPFPPPRCRRPST